MSIDKRTKSWAEYIHEAMGLGLLAGSVFGLISVVKNDSWPRMWVFMALGAALGIGLKLAQGRTTTVFTTKKDQEGSE
jgi:hypothetical protein